MRRRVQERISTNPFELIATYLISENVVPLQVHRVAKGLCHHRIFEEYHRILEC